MKQTSELDWLFGWMVADRATCLGNARVFVKKILKYVPVVGWAWNFRYLNIFYFSPRFKFESFAKDDFFSECAMCFLDLQISKKIYSKKLS